MAVRLPLTTVLDYDDIGNVGATSVAGGVAKSFFIPQDTDNIVVKLTASVSGGAVSAIFQTTDDGGVTYYDVGRTSIVSLVNNANAQWLSMSTLGMGLRTGVIQSSSVITAAIGNTAASTLGSQQNSGLPILSTLNRVFLVYTGNVTVNNGARVQVKTNNQSATA